MEADTKLEIIEKINHMKALLYLRGDLPKEIREMYESKIQTWEIEIELLMQFSA